MNAPAEILRHIPLRTCIATRSTQPRDTLLRVVAQTRDNGDIVIVPDPHCCLPGRGAWITPHAQALALAEKRHAFSRALKVPAPVDVREIRAYIYSLVAIEAGGVT